MRLDTFVWKDFKMCKKLKSLNGLTPDFILDTYWSKDRNVYPIDISKILFKMGIRVQPFDFSKYNNNVNDRILGAMVANEEDLVLLYGQGETNSRNRFTLAHELAHCCLTHINEKSMPYIEYRHDGVVEDRNEIRANEFAAELLIPLKELCKILASEYHDTIPPVTELAEMFKVSHNVMKERLRCLKIPYIDEYNRKMFCLE